jgi:RimJ/RimL family protein N-acetyltransferase
LTGRLVTLREPVAGDAAALLDLLSLDDATGFGLGEPLTEVAVRRLIDRSHEERAAATAFTFVLVAPSQTVVGLIRVRELDPGFDVGEWECTIRPAVRGSGVFPEAARLAASFAFGVVGTWRLESRVLLQNGRGNTALRKLGAVQEGILRRSARSHGEYLDQVLWAVLKADFDDEGQPSAPRVH